MAYRKNRSLRVGVAGLAVAATAVLTMPAVATADPTTPDTTTPDTTTPGTATPDTAEPSAPSTSTPTTPAPDGASPSTTLPEIPGDAELADLLRTLKSTGGTEKAVEALTAILSSDGQLDPSKYLGSTGLLDSIGLDQLGLDKLGILSPDEPGSTTPTAPDAPAVPSAATPSPAAAPVATSAADVLDVLKKATGATLLSPAVSPLCTDPTADNPLGLSTAPAVAVPGPWPRVASQQSGALAALSELLPDDKNLLTAIAADETAFALVPPGEPGADNFRVAWFNTSTLDGGMADLKPLSEASKSGPLKQLLADTELFHGLRLAQVKTGRGTILTAVFGTTTKAGRTCFFLPALGTVKN
ncbi:hypothetical protein [Gordonia hydrophobica]|uniref:Uncharacterized protein n=1 Tax=Gordonia hydrophobica TaxID=40516 RepID=A0ABZ2U4J2_9ACTN|nr:hypothetical protein [Gordonia hydrophobica]MBM7366837.1 hypothetical protein [Gordonia hydrophobica]